MGRHQGRRSAGRAKGRPHRPHRLGVMDRAFGHRPEHSGPGLRRETPGRRRPALVAAAIPGRRAGWPGRRRLPFMAEGAEARDHRGFRRRRQARCGFVSAPRNWRPGRMSSMRSKRGRCGWSMREATRSTPARRSARSEAVGSPGPAIWSGLSSWTRTDGSSTRPSFAPGPPRPGSSRVRRSSHTARAVGGPRWTHSCSSGSASQLRNYYAGWSDWGNIEDTPVETGPATRPER